MLFPVGYKTGEQLDLLREISEITEVRLKAPHKTGPSRLFGKRWTWLPSCWVAERETHRTVEMVSAG
jgi:hypothetical protein